MIWLVSICLAASLLANLFLLILIWDMDSRHRAHALTLIDMADELAAMQEVVRQADAKIAEAKASGRIII